MKRLIHLIISITILTLLFASPVLANPGKPDFTPGVYADGEAWGTKGTANLPPPNSHNEQSYDLIFVIMNSNNPGTQLPVGEAAPGNPMYNGGRWSAQEVYWTQAGFDAHGTVPILMSYDEVMHHYSLGHLTITSLGVYFQCPLLPVK